MRNKTTAAVFAFFLGGIGGHKFYLGKPIQGLLYLAFCWTFIPAVVAFIEAIMLLMMSDADFNLKFNAGLMLVGAASPQNIVVNVANTAQAGADDLPAKLKSLSDLRTAGVLTEEEFQTQKHRALSAGR